jgi:glycosyltransferase involved in cell wall biosynthesis
MVEKNKLEISIVVLCYKAGKEIIKFIECIYSRGCERKIEFEIILVANYWPKENDITPEIVNRYSLNKINCIVVSLPKRGMMGWDMRSGLEKASGRVIVVIDGDTQFEPDLVFWVYDKLRTDNLDLCKTYRVDREDGIYRKLISNIFNYFFMLLFPVKKYKKEYRDINSKPKAILNSAYRKMNLKADDWFIDAEIMLQARKLKLIIGSFPISFYKSKRESFVKPIAIIEFIKNLVHYWIRGISYKNKAFIDRK